MRRLGVYSQKGAVLVFFALLLPIIVFFAGMAIDFGRAYMHKSQLQNAADAAALAGVTAAAGSEAANLVDTLPSGSLQNGENDKLIVAKDAANVVLVKDTGAASAGESNTKLRMTKEGTNPKVDVDTYYYMVELTDEVKMVFAQLFLPQSLLPDDWNVKVSAKAWAKARINDNIDLLTQMLNLEAKETSSTFQTWQKHVGGNFTTAQILSFTNDGVLYDYENKKRSEVFNMNNGDTERKDLFINFKQDIWAKSPFGENWNLSDWQGKSYDELSEIFYDTTNADKPAKLLLIMPKGTLTTENITLDAYIRRYAEAVDGYSRKTLDDLTGKNYANYEHIDDALAMLTSTIKDVINVNVCYEKRDVANLPESEVSFKYNSNERNLQDPLFVKIESEEFNTKEVTNTVRDISINIGEEADNTVKINDQYIYRPLVFFYDGPVDVDNERGKGRKSNTVVVNLKANFRGIIFAPNSPVQVIGNQKEFYGFIIAQSIIDPDGNELSMPGKHSAAVKPILQDFYTKLNLRHAEYDDLGVVKLLLYKNPGQDFVFLTNRASITR